MFAYCGNNPVNCLDPTGHFGEEFWNAFKESVNQANAIFALAGGISQLDSPALGPADLVAIGIVGLTAIACAVQAVNLSATTQVQPFFLKKQDSISDELGSIADSFGMYQCKNAAESMVDYLKKNNQHGSIITITYTNSRGFVWSDIAGTTISTNGVHVGIEYNGIVYCNVHPLGLPEIMWVNDFYATGEKIVTKIPF